VQLAQSIIAFVCVSHSHPSPPQMYCLAHTCHNLRVAVSTKQCHAHKDVRAEGTRWRVTKPTHKRQSCSCEARSAMWSPPHPCTARNEGQARRARAKSVRVCLATRAEHALTESPPRWETGGAGQQRAWGAVYRWPRTLRARRWGLPHRPHVETRQGRHTAPPPTSGHAGE
jgi:hypothetical protein